MYFQTSYSREKQRAYRNFLENITLDIQHIQFQAICQKNDSFKSSNQQEIQDT
jgi:hypothetical protein